MRKQQSNPNVNCEETCKSKPKLKSTKFTKLKDKKKDVALQDCYIQDIYKINS